MGQIDLPGRLNFQTTAADLEFQDALSKIVYPVRIPTPYFYPKSPYALKGLGDTCLPYDFYALQQAFGVTDCGVAPYTSDPATQYACQQRNAPLLQQIALLSPSYGTCITQSMIPGPYNPSPVNQTNPYLDPFTGTGLFYNPANPATPSSSPQYVGPYNPVTPGTITYTNPPASAFPPSSTPPPTGGGAYHPHVTFTPSRQGTLYPGDTWSLQITGGAPRTPVSVYGGPNGQYQTNTMGATDGNGNFTLSGSIDSTMYGQIWGETWYVGSDNAGSFSFTIGAAPGGTGSPPPSYTPPAGTPPSGTPPSQGAPPASGGTQPPAATGTTWIPGVSNTVVMAGAGLLLLMTMMGGRR